MVARRQYSDNDKAAALAALDANGGNTYKTAKDTGINRQTLANWANGRGVNHDMPNLVHQKKGELAERLMDVAHLLVDAIPDKIADASLQQVSTSLGIAIEKIQLLQGEATSRSDIRMNRLPALPDDQLDNIFGS
jgi:hypothetical protein